MEPGAFATMARRGVPFCAILKIFGIKVLQFGSSLFPVESDKMEGMTPKKLFHELLGLGPNWEVIESRFEQQSGTVFLEIRETPQLWELVRCPEDGGLAFCYDHTEWLTWRHLDVFQYRCEIRCRLPVSWPAAAGAL